VVNNSKKDSFLGPLLFISFTILSSCKVQTSQNTLLTDGAGCSSLESCDSNNAPTTITGDLSLEVPSQTILNNLEKSDLTEISGSCTDLGRKNNRIIVQVFNRDDNFGSLLPYIDNTVSPLCLDVATNLTVDNTPATGLVTGEQCFFVSQGSGISDATQMYPQCINGKFSFSVRVGNVTRVAGVKKKYIVRMKLRTLDGALQESGWADVFIDRNLGSPSFTATPDSAAFSCKLVADAFKFNHAIVDSANSVTPKINYSFFYKENFFTAAGLASYDLTVAPVPLGTNLVMSFPVATNNTSPADFKHTNLVPGIRYEYQAQSIQPSTTESSDLSLSTAQSCAIAAPWVTNISIDNVGKTCMLTLGGGSNPAYSYDCAYSKSAKWTTSNGAITPVNTSLSCSSTSMLLNMNALPDPPGTVYYVAIRVRSSNPAKYGKWSTYTEQEPEYKCTKP